MVDSFSDVFLRAFCKAMVPDTIPVHDRAQAGGRELGRLLGNVKWPVGDPAALSGHTIGGMPVEHIAKALNGAAMEDLRRTHRTEPPAGEATPEQERVAFEVWLLIRGWSNTRDLAFGDLYSAPESQAAWSAWQERSEAGGTPRDLVAAMKALRTSDPKPKGE